MLTVLIPTHNRPNYLWRCLDYLARTARDAILVIADSSEQIIFEKNVSLIREQFLDIRIVHLDCRGKGITDKYAYALSTIDTPFVVACGDDDFLVYKNAVRCAEFMIENEDYSHAHGRIITFWEQTSTLHPVKRIQEYKQIKNDGVARDRLSRHFSEYHNSFYSVHRTASLRNNINEVNKLNAGRGLKERALAALDICQGKRMMLDCLFMLRQKGMTGLDENGNRTFPDNPKNRDYFQTISFGYDAYVQLITRYLSHINGIDGKDKAIIIEAIKKDYEKWKRIRCASVADKRTIANRARKVIGMVRLRLRHYKTLHSIEPSDIDHYRLAVESMQKFHALRSSACL